MGWADRESLEALAEMILAVVRRFELDLGGATGHLDDLRIYEVKDQIDAISHAHFGDLRDIAVALKAKIQP